MPAKHFPPVLAWPSLLQSWPWDFMQLRVVINSGDHLRRITWKARFRYSISGCLIKFAVIKLACFFFCMFLKGPSHIDIIISLFSLLFGAGAGARAGTGFSAHGCMARFALASHSGSEMAAAGGWSVRQGEQLRLQFKVSLCWYLYLYQFQSLSTCNSSDFEACYCKCLLGWRYCRNFSL